MHLLYKITFVFLLIFNSDRVLFAQQQVDHIIPNKVTTDIVKAALDYTYNFEFEESKKLCEQIRKRHPNHPGADFMMALNIYWEMFYNDTYQQQSGQFLTYLNKTLELSKKMVAVDEKDVEGVFFKLAAECYLALYYSERNETSTTLSYAKKMYSSIKVAMKLKDKLNEFYFPSGIYNYYVVMYPEVHPVFKPFMFMFMSGSKATGFKEMDYAWKHAVFCKMECAYHLCNIYIKYEGTPLLAYEYTKALNDKYPKNIFFALRHCEVLLAKGEYVEAKKLADRLNESGKKYFVATSYVFYGILSESNKDPENASKNFLKAIQSFKETLNPECDYLSFAYAGMGRYYKNLSNKAKATEYYKKCKEIAEYHSIVLEADSYLSKKQ
jgi:tetratricopeptide (TPR) repeat protein